jgi:type I restriction enzyme S subunit
MLQGTQFKDSPVGRIPVGWQERKLGDMSKVSSSNVDKKTNSDEIPIRLCNYMDVYSNSCIRSDLDFMPATAKESEVQKFTLKQGDVIITKDSETPDDIAISSYVSEELDNILCGYHLAMIRPHQEELSGKFLSFLFAIDQLKSYFAKSANGTTRFGLNIDSILNTPIIIPPLAEQQKIASILTSIDDSIQQQQRELQQTQNLKKSLRQDLLTGQVRVKVD